MNVPLPAYISSTMPGSAPTASITAATSAALAARPTWAKPPAGIASGGLPGSATSTSARPSVGLPASARPTTPASFRRSISRRACAGAEGVGARDVQVNPLGARLRLELDAGRHAAGERAQRRQRARQLGPEQRTARRIAEIDDVV